MTTASWVHGNSVRAQWVGNPPMPQVQSTRFDGSSGGVPWTDIVGLPQGPGQIFRGNDASAGPFGSRVVPQPSRFFHVSVPTPVLVGNVRTAISKVFVLWTSDRPGIVVQEVHVFDGVNRIDGPAVDLAAAGQGRSGSGGLGDLVTGVTMFDVAGMPPVFWGIGISVGVAFAGEGQITFHAAGADFEP